MKGKAEDPVVELGDRLHSAAIHLLRHLRSEDEGSGLTAPKLSALSVVVFRGPITLGDLARAEQVTPPTVTRVVADLERSGLVSRRSDPDDGRVRWVEATERGVRLLQEGRRRRVARLADGLRALPERERRNLRTAVSILERLLKPTP